MNVRIEQGVFHFVLGEMVPGQSGKAEFIPAFRGVVPEGEAAKLFEFLKQKADAHTPHAGVGAANKEMSGIGASIKVDDQTELLDPFKPLPQDVVRKRKIATSDGEPHTK